MDSKFLFTTAYFPPVQYLAKIKQGEEIYIEQYENFGKQSFRNRCEIMTANGVISLTVPVLKANSKTLLKDLKIVYPTNWQKLHYKGIESAYKNSPYYEYYIDDLLPFFGQKETYLLDLNNKILETLLGFFKLERVIYLTDDYIRPGHPDFTDLRDTIHPKTSHRETDTSFTACPYRQTFCDRIPFTPNLSCLDLLFNLGPDASSYLTKCIR